MAQTMEYNEHFDKTVGLFRTFMIDLKFSTCNATWNTVLKEKCLTTLMEAADKNDLELLFDLLELLEESILEKSYTTEAKAWQLPLYRKMFEARYSVSKDGKTNPTCFIIYMQLLETCLKPTCFSSYWTTENRFPWMIACEETKNPLLVFDFYKNCLSNLKVVVGITMTKYDTLAMDVIEKLKKLAQEIETTKTTAMTETTMMTYTENDTEIPKDELEALCTVKTDDKMNTMKNKKGEIPPALLMKEKRTMDDAHKVTAYTHMIHHIFYKYYKIVKYAEEYKKTLKGKAFFEKVKPYLTKTPDCKLYFDGIDMHNVDRVKKILSQWVNDESEDKEDSISGEVLVKETSAKLLTSKRRRGKQSSISKIITSIPTIIEYVDIFSHWFTADKKESVDQDDHIVLKTARTTLAMDNVNRPTKVLFLSSKYTDTATSIEVNKNNILTTYQNLTE